MVLDQGVRQRAMLTCQLLEHEGTGSGLPDQRGVTVQGGFEVSEGVELFARLGLRVSQ